LSFVLAQGRIEHTFDTGGRCQVDVAERTRPGADWSSRPVPAAMSPEKLASFVEGAQRRTEGLLFTATPAAELDEIGRWQQLQDQAFAGLCRAIVAAYNRAGVEEREFVADEVGLAIGASSSPGRDAAARAVPTRLLPVAELAPIARPTSSATNSRSSAAARL
jgi:hypothetical protein